MSSKRSSTIERVFSMVQLMQSGDRTVPELAFLLGTDRKRARRYVHAARAEGLIERAPDRPSKWDEYDMPPTGQKCFAYRWVRS